ncbi:hypothetical protein AB4144_46690, partial [Rhizobiaceae sp. 2RAB30]
MDVFGKDAEFDPSTDAVVRVQAGRLRDLLAQYYATEGAGDPLRVIIPRGSYVPAYRVVLAKPKPDEAASAGAAPALAVPEAASATPPLEPAYDQPVLPASALSPQLAKQVRLFWMAMGAVIAMLGFVVLRTALPLQGPVETASVTQDPSLSTASIAVSYPPG